MIDRNNDRNQKIVQDIKNRLARLDDKRKRFVTIWKEIAEYVFPYLDLYIQENPETRGKKTGTKVYNGTPINAASFFANGLQGYLVSRHMDWFKIIMEDQFIKDLPDVREYLQEIERIIYNVFQGTNFYSSINEFFKFGGGICTSTLFIEEDKQENKICFTARHPIEIFIDVNRFNQVDTIYRQFYMSARLCRQEFGEENLTDGMKKCLENHSDKEFEIIHAIEPRVDRKEWKKDSKNKKFASVYIATEENVLLRESGFDYLPGVVWRPDKNMTQIYGGGPGINALVDILTVNQISKDILHASHLAVNPAYQAHENMRGQINIFPSGISYYQNDNELIRPVHVPSNFPVGVDREAKIEMIIKKHFFVDFFLMMAEAEKTMTATEIMEKQGEKAVMLGPAVTNLSDDCLNPIFDIVFNKLFEAGKLPPPPPALEQYGGQDIIKIDYLGPLAQVQKRLFNNQGILRSLQAAQGILTNQPETADLINWDKTVQRLLETNGMPQDLINDEKEVFDIRASRREAMAQQQSMEAGQAMADMAGKLNKKVDSGSIIDQIQQQAAGATPSV